MVTLHSTGSQPPRFRVLAFLAAGYIVSAFLLAPSQVTADVSQAIGAITAAVFVIHAMQRNALRLPGELILLGGFVVYTLVGVFVSVEVTTVVSRAMTLTQLWILAVVVFNVFTSSAEGHRVGFRAVQVGALAVALMAIMAPTYGSGRVAGVLGNPNQYGVSALLGIGATLLLGARSRLEQGVHAIIIGFLATQIAWSGSRNALLGLLILLVLGAAILIARTRRRPAQLVVTVSLVILAAVGIIAWLETTPFWYRVESLLVFLGGGEVQEGSVYARAEFAKLGLQLWMNNPILGLGADQYKYHAAALGLRQTYSHANPIEILANFGIIGALLYYGMYIRLSGRLVSAWRRQKVSGGMPYTVCILGAVWIAYVALEVARVSYLAKVHWITIALILAMAYNLERSGRERNDPSTMPRVPRHLSDDRFATRLGP